MRKTRCEERASTFAPQSMSRDTPVSVGISGAKGGRSIPRILPTITCPPTNTAPELPADTNASASFCFTIFIPTTIAEVLNVDEEEISMETTFVDDLGADSLDVFQIIMGLEEEFDIEIPNEEAEKIVTVGDAVEQIKSALN